MKNLVITLIFLGMFAVPALTTPVFAQDEPDMYYVNVAIEKVYTTNMGYVIQYRTQKGIDTVGIPLSWFVEAAGKADIVRLPTGGDWPSMSIFYDQGKLSHIRMYVSRVRSHVTWGVIPQGTDVSKFFPEGDSIEIRF